MFDLTLKAIADRIGIGESSLRNYRNWYEDFVPYSGEGRNRRHPEAAVEILKTISGLYDQGKNRDQITAILYKMYPVNPTAMTATQTQDRTQQPQQERKMVEVSEEMSITATTATETQRLPERLPQSPQAMMAALFEGMDRVVGEVANILAKRNALAADSLPDILTIQEAAGLARVSADTLRKKMKADPTFPVQAFGSRKRVPKDQFMIWMGGGVTQ